MINDLIRRLIDIEGGFVNDSADSGGATRYGVTHALARSWGYMGDMEKLPLDQAIFIYKQEFAYPFRLDEIANAYPDVAFELLEMSVHMGARKTATFLQRAINVLTQDEPLQVDGIFGTKTHLALLALLKRGDEGIITKMLDCQQGNFYITLAAKRKKDKRFIRGWFNKRIGE